MKRFIKDLKRFIKDLKRFINYALYNASSELKAEVANSYLNWIWWVLEPTAYMFIYAFVFGNLFNNRNEYFLTFIFIGVTTWEFFSRSLKNSVNLIRANKSIVSKVYLPKFVLVLSKMIVNAFKMFISWGILLVLIIVQKVPINMNFLYIIPYIVLLMIFTFGCMTIITHFGVFVQDLKNIIDIVLKMTFYVTGVFYSVQTRFAGLLGSLMLRLNPLTVIIEGLRSSIIYGQTPARKLMIAWYIVALVLVYLGVKLIYKYENSYVKVI